MERPHIIPAPYLARAQWVALETRDAVPRDELAGLLRESYELVAAKLPRKIRESLSSSKPIKPKPTKRKAADRKPKKRKRPPSR